MSGTLDAYANTQYRPVSTVETGEDQPLSVRAYADYASAINNYKMLVGAPRRGQICFPHWESEDNTTAQHVVQVFGPLYVPDGYSVIRYDACTRRSAGTADVIWTVYASQTPYFGNRTPFSAATFLGNFDTQGFTTNNDSWKWNDATSSDMVIYSDQGSQFIYITLLATNGDASSRSEMSYFGFRAELR
tara:strand:- start:874 stop:1440 length:567 start_codon:yes stop_codon:yes gene_type:complete